VTTADAERPATLGQRQVRLAVADLSLCEGEPERALRLLEDLRGDTITAPSVDLVRARALRVLGRLGEAEAALRAAYQLASASRLVSVTWRLQSELATTLDAQWRAADADAARAEALSIVNDVARGLADAQLASEFLAAAHRAMGVHARTRARLSRGRSGLTTREREVAMLIAAGCTNRTMAERLVLSERTIESHVSGILSKLGFSSRAQIATWATQERLVNT
jgi:DNA-binding NarL/FixJ family response regulator